MAFPPPHWALPPPPPNYLNGAAAPAPQQPQAPAGFPPMPQGYNFTMGHPGTFGMPGFNAGMINGQAWIHTPSQGMTLVGGGGGQPKRRRQQVNMGLLGAGWPVSLDASAPLPGQGFAFAGPGHTLGAAPAPIPRAAASPTAAPPLGKDRTFDRLVQTVFEIRIDATFTTRKAVWAAYRQAGKDADKALEALMARDEKEKQKERDEGKRKERERKKEEREALRKKNAAPYPVQHHKRPIASSPGNTLANNGFAKQDDPSQNYRGASSPVKAFSGAPPRQLDDAQRYITAVEAKKRCNVTRVDLKGVHFNNDARWSDGVSVRFYKEEDVKKRALEIAEKKRELELADKARRQ